MTAPFRSELSRWATDLNLFAEDVALALDGMCARLGVAIGAMSARPLAVDGEPDGFDGLVTRGLYERLMLSEWLLATEMPEEFDRRAATGEHLFLKLARRRPDAARASVVLFDSSACQLGAPRIVQLALLVTLARRAAANRARFAWSLADEPEAALFEAIDAKSVREFLAARRASRLREESIHQWLVRTRSLFGRDAEVWLVGGRACVGRASRVVMLADTLETTEAVRVQVHSRGSQPREVILDMPESGVAARIVRDPFSDAPPARGASSAQPASNLVFSGNGVKLFARGANHTAIIIPVPNSARAPLGRIRVVAARGPVLAAGVGGSKTQWLVIDEVSGFVDLRREPARGGHRVAPADALPVGVNDALAPLLFVRGAKLEWWDVLWRGSLVRLGKSEPPGVVATGVLDLVPTHYGYDFIAEQTTLENATPERKWPYVAYNAHGGTTFVHFCERPPVHALIARTRQRSFGPLFAYTVDRSNWDVVAHNGRARLSPSGESIIGLTGTGIVDAGFVMLDNGRRTIRITSKHEDVTLVRAATPVAHTAISPHGVLAWLTEDNELGFVSLVTRKIFQQRRLGKKP